MKLRHHHCSHCRPSSRSSVQKVDQVGVGLTADGRPAPNNSVEGRRLRTSSSSTLADDRHIYGTSLEIQSTMALPRRHMLLNSSGWGLRGMTPPRRNTTRSQGRWVPSGTSDQMINLICFVLLSALRLYHDSLEISQLQTEKALLFQEIIKQRLFALWSHKILINLRLVMKPIGSLHPPDIHVTGRASLKSSPVFLYSIFELLPCIPVQYSVQSLDLYVFN